MSQKQPDDQETREILLPPEEQEKLLQEVREQHPELGSEDLTIVVQQVHQSRQWSAPMPPPDTLADYEQILPGSAERILAMAEKEQNSRHSFDHKDIDLATKERLRGQVFGFAALLLCLACASGFAYAENNWAAGLFLAAPVVAVVSKFIIK